jgi:iron complex transport system substrate-binding protein
MAGRPLRVLAVVVGLLAAARVAAPAGDAPAPRPPERIVSMNPSLTAIVLALGAGPQLVGVDAYSKRQQEALAALPSVGGLYSPSLEAVVELRPDLVVLVPSAEQRDFRERLAALGIPVLALDPLGFDEVLATIEALGGQLGRSREAQARVEAIRATRARVEREVAGRPRVRTLLVLQREPFFVVGRGSFIDEMLRMAGAENLGATFPEPYPRVEPEWLIAAAPEVILDASDSPEAPERFWSRWPSLPAVAHGHVVALGVGVATLPGPYLDRALEALARGIHGDDVLAQPEPARAAPAP